MLHLLGTSWTQANIFPQPSHTVNKRNYSLLFIIAVEVKLQMRNWKVSTYTYPQTKVCDACDVPFYWEGEVLGRWGLEESVFFFLSSLCMVLRFWTVCHAWDTPARVWLHIKLFNKVNVWLLLFPLLADIVVVVKLASVHVYCNPINYPLLLPYIAHWRNLHIHCLNKEEVIDN